MHQARFLRVISIIACGWISLAASAAQAALVFSFSIENNVVDPGNAIDGTVTGRIFGLDDDTAGQAATSVVIDSFPAGLGGVVDEAEVLNWTNVDFNTFDVSGGEITRAIFAATLVTSDLADLDQLCFRTVANGTCSTFLNVFTMDKADTYVANTNIAGVTFTQYVPIPPTIGLLANGLVLIGWFQRRSLARRKHRTV